MPSYGLGVRSSASQDRAELTPDPTVDDRLTDATGRWPRSRDSFAVETRFVLPEGSRMHNLARATEGSLLAEGCERAIDLSADGRLAGSGETVWQSSG